MIILIVYMYSIVSKRNFLKTYFRATSRPPNLNLIFKFFFSNGKCNIPGVESVIHTIPFLRFYDSE